MGTNCAPLIADLFLFCYERDFMALFLIIKKLKLFKHVTLHQDIYFEGMLGRIYPTELQLNTANASETETHSWIYIYPFQTVLFHPKFMISAMT